MDRRVVEIRRRRNGVGFDCVRSGAGSAFYWSRQRRAVEPAHSQPARRRYFIYLLDCGAAAGNRRIRVALPGKSGRGLGLRFRRANDFGGFDDCGGGAESFTARAEEWDFLRTGSRDGGADFGCALYAHYVGERGGPENRAAYGDGVGALSRAEYLIGDSRTVGRA